MTDFTYAFLNYTAEIPNVTYAKMGDMYSKFKTVCTNYTSTALRACANAACTKPADLAITDAFAKNTDFYCKLENNATNNLLSDGWFTLSRIPSCALNSCLNDKYFSRGSRDFFWNLQTEAGFTDMCFGYNYTSFEECASSMSLGKCGAEDLAAIKTVESSFTKVCSLFTANRTKPRTTTTTASATSTRATVSTATPSKTSAAFGVFATFNLIFVVGVLSLLEL
ncbi:hypothetical protein BDR26DRAFT_856687 [Obelidium mucronatum]|nr:hypothetical protein BDR26DRAFT_856687 [Obelidium mucronatum]